MDENEFSDVEGRLRRAAAGRRPGAPDELLRFIDEVPERYQRRRGLTLKLALPRLRGRFALAATAVALVVAVAAGTLLVSMRNSQNAAADPAAPSMAGWTWQRADGTILGSHISPTDQQAFQVANGFIGTCGGGDQEALCTSADGLHWTTPADPAIVVAVGSRQFMPHEVVRSGSVWIALDLGGPSGGVPVLWRSTDGVHWSQVDSPGFKDLSLAPVVAVLATGFVVEASEYAAPPDFAFTSTDGLTWTRSSQLPVSPMYLPDSGPMRLVVSGDMSDSATGQVWQTLDGKTWTPVQLPGVLLARAYSLADGGFVGWGWKTTNGTSTPAENSAVASYHILRSTDGVSWQVDQGDLQGEPCSLVVVGDRLFAAVLSPACDTAPLDSAVQIWQSSDSGRTWQPVVDSSGKSMSGKLWRMGDRVTISSWDPETSAWRLAWVGTPTSSTP